MPGRRTDTTHAPIREALRRCGWTVTDTSRIGHGFPDLVAVRAGHGVMLEIKTGRAGLTPAEEAMHALLRACGVEVRVVRTVEEAIGG